MPPYDNSRKRNSRVQKVLTCDNSRKGDPGSKSRFILSLATNFPLRKKNIKIGTFKSLDI